MEDNKYNELNESLKIVTSLINNCEKAQVKFKEGTSQFSLLYNRLKALYISKLLIINLINNNENNIYSKEELIYAITPLNSVISKCEKAQMKNVLKTSYQTRLNNIIKAIKLSINLIKEEISQN